MAGFKSRWLVTGQTYTRKLDCDILAAVAGIDTFAHNIPIQRKYQIQDNLSHY